MRLFFFSLNKTSFFAHEPCSSLLRKPPLEQRRPSGEEENGFFKRHRIADEEVCDGGTNGSWCSKCGDSKMQTTQRRFNLVVLLLHLTLSCFSWADAFAYGPVLSLSSSRAPASIARHRQALRMTGSEQGYSAYSAFLLDFDGTLCDSVADTTGAAFSAANILWPEDMKAALALDPRDAGVRKSWVGGDWSEYADDKRITEDIPRWLEEKMRQLRPVVSRGSDAVLAARLIVTDAVNSKASSLGERPLAVGEIVENWDVLRESMLYRVKFQPEELEESFADHRTDRLMSLQDWVARNPVFGGIAASLSKTDKPLYVITRREVKFVKSVLEENGVTVAADRIICVEQDRSKVDVLVELVSKVGTSAGQAPLVYVDDNVNVVREVVADLRLAGKLRVFFAEWGYSSPSQKAMAARYPRVTNINVQQFADLISANQ